MTLDAFASSLTNEVVKAASPTALQPLRQAAHLRPTGDRAGDGDGALGLLFEVELWRQDMLTSVVEIDAKGNLIHGGLANPLCPPGEAFRV